MKTARKAIILFITVLLLTVSGCGIRETSVSEQAVMDFAPAARSAGSGVMVETASKQNFSAPLMLEEERKKILTAYIELEVTDLGKTEQVLYEIIAAFNGWVDQSSVWETSFSITTRIPAEQLDSFLEQTGTLGKLLSKSLSADDVTDYYSDTEARLETLYILQERYTEYLRNAGNMEEILAIERELNNTIAEIESMERTMRRLSGQIDYASVHLTARLPAEKQVDTRLPNIREGIKRFGYGFISLLYYIGLGLLYAVVFGVPLILALGLLYLIGWGRIGLVRKFFRLLSRKHRRSTGQPEDE